MQNVNVSTIVCSILFLFVLLFNSACMPDRAKRVEQAEVHFRIAQQLAMKDENIQALAETLTAVELDSQNHEIHNFLGLLYVQRNMKKEAEKHYRKAVSLDSNYSEAHNHLCALLIDQMQYDEAIQECKKAIENVRYSTPERAYHNMGLAYERKGDFNKAKDSYNKGLIHNQKFVMTLKALGKVYFQEKSFDQAASVFQKAAKVCKDSASDAWGMECPESFYQLAMSYVRLQQRKLAILSLKDCVQSTAEDTVFGKKCRASLRVYE